MFNAQKAAFALFVGTTVAAAVIVGPTTGFASTAIPLCQYGACYYSGTTSVNCGQRNSNCGCYYLSDVIGYCALAGTPDSKK